MGFSGGSGKKNSPANAGDLGSVAGLGRCPGDGKGNPPQYSYLGNPMDTGASLATVHGVAKSNYNNKLQYTQHSCLLNLLTQEGWGSYKGKPLPIARGCVLRLFHTQCLHESSKFRVIFVFTFYLYFYILRKQGYPIFSGHACS